FSGRRRHTSFSRDWSSDVCSSDLGSLPGPTHAPSHRIRLRGGQIGSVLAYGPSSDIVFDGVAINNGVVPSASRSATGVYLPAGADRKSGGWGKSVGAWGRRGVVGR